MQIRVSYETAEPIHESYDPVFGEYSLLFAYSELPRSYGIFVEFARTFCQYLVELLPEIRVALRHPIFVKCDIMCEVDLRDFDF